MMVKKLLVGIVILVGMKCYAGDLHVRPYVADNDTVFLYHLDETNGAITAADSSTNGLTLTRDTISPFQGTNGPAGLSGAAGSFSNFDPVLSRNFTTNEVALISATNFTLEMWCRNPRLEYTNDSDVLLQMRPYPTPDPGERLQLSVSDGKWGHAGRLELAYYSSSNATVVPASNVVTWETNVWYHIAVTYDSNTPASNDSIVKFYMTKFGDLTANLLDTQTNQKDMNPLSVATPLRIGAADNQAQHRYWGGDIDEVRFTNRTLDPSEFNLAAPPKGTVVTVN